ncbi:unnamed protein product [Soboliphyme baturini]|uniref:LRRCT domain-containing protein n=1 Tax=Soboliphyme baturini TaxID=241478 RepID=A0A183IE09_9BILA|nr:unnamed protein product [Soboliphyme baturini]
MPLLNCLLFQANMGMMEFTVAVTVLLLRQAVRAQQDDNTCPQDCTCSTANGPQRAVRCVNGGLNDDNFTKLIATVSLLSTSIYIAGNRISHILPETFENSPHIETLVLKGNEISIELLPTGVFSGMRSLRLIDLSSNRKAGPLPPNTFAGLENVTVFDDIPRLQRIRLRNCSIRSFPRWAFQQHTALSDMHIGDNGALGLGSIGRVLANLPTLQSLDISGSGGFRDVAAAPSFATARRWIPRGQLRRLIMQRCLLDDSEESRAAISGILASAGGGIEELDLCYNEFRNFSAADVLAVGAGSIKKLRLCHNHIDAITATLLKGTVQLRYLDLSDNAITRLPSNMPSELLRLDQLNLSGNAIQDVTASQLLLLSAVRSLDLSRCNVSLPQGSDALYEKDAPHYKLSEMHHERTTCNHSNNRQIPSSESSSTKSRNADETAAVEAGECFGGESTKNAAAGGNGLIACANTSDRGGYGTIGVMTIVLVAAVTIASLVLVAVLLVRYRKAIYRTHEEKDAPFRQNYFSADNLDEKYLHCNVYSVLDDSLLHSMPKLADIDDV